MYVLPVRMGASHNKRTRPHYPFELSQLLERHVATPALLQDMVHSVLHSRNTLRVKEPTAMPCLLQWTGTQWRPGTKKVLIGERLGQVSDIASLDGVVKPNHALGDFDL
jgi:hypothetical protein